MRKIFYTVMVLLLIGKLGYCETANIQVKLTLLTSEIYTGQAIVANVEVINTGTVDLQLPRPDMSEFNDLLTPDNPNLWFSGGVGITSINGAVPTVSVKPGESVSTKIYLSGKTHDRSPITFKMSFKTSADAPLVWSNQVTVRFKNDADLPVKIEVWLRENNINISDVHKPQNATAYISITNISEAPQDIGMDDLCGVQELNDLISDNKAIGVDSAMVACLQNPFPPREVILKPGEVYHQSCQIEYKGEEPAPQPVVFRVGVKSVGHLPAWSNPVTVNIVGGSEDWTKHIIYVENFTKQQTGSHPDGVNKTYFENGTISEECSYKDGKRDGHCKHYSQDGKLNMDENYSENKLVGYISYNQDGSIHGDMEFMILENGNYVSIPNGPCTKADSDQQVLGMFLPKCGN